MFEQNYIAIKCQYIHTLVRLAGLDKKKVSYRDQVCKTLLHDANLQQQARFVWLETKGHDLDIHRNVRSSHHPNSRWPQITMALTCQSEKEASAMPSLSGYRNKRTRPRHKKRTVCSSYHPDGHKQRPRRTKNYTLILTTNHDGSDLPIRKRSVCNALCVYFFSPSCVLSMMAEKLWLKRHPLSLDHLRPSGRLGGTVCI